MMGGYKKKPDLIKRQPKPSLITIQQEVIMGIKQQSEGKSIAYLEHISLYSDVAHFSTILTVLGMYKFEE